MVPRGQQGPPLGRHSRGALDFLVQLFPKTLVVEEGEESLGEQRASSSDSDVGASELGVPAVEPALAPGRVLLWPCCPSREHTAHCKATGTLLNLCPETTVFAFLLAYETKTILF